MNFTNKEVIDKLTAYFNEDCEKEAVCQALAGMSIDIVRFLNIDSLTDAERNSLIWRSEHMKEELRSFIKNGPNGPLKSARIRSDE